jgi:4-amino-4-deoxy-L-arabinose transferase-like glycosyltransferase
MARHRALVAVCLGGVLVLSALLVAIPAGRRPFWASDEARVALLARDAVEHGRWLVADVRGEPYLNKPQLTFWGVALSSVPLGHVTEMSAAIPGVLASVAAVAGVIAIGWRLGGWTTAAMAGLILATTPLHFAMGHQVLPDMPLTAWLVWSLYCLNRAASTNWSVGALLGFYVCLTAAFLSKGPAALAGVAGAGVAVALTDGAAALRRLRPVVGAAVVLVLVSALWLVPYQLRAAATFRNKTITEDYMGRYMVGSIAGRLQSLTEPLVVFLPWTLLLAAAPVWWRQSRDPARRRIVVWTATLWVLFAMTGRFRSRYVLPVLPGLALLTAHVIMAPVAGRAARALRWASIVASVAAVATAIVLAVPALQPVLARAFVPEERVFFPTAPWERATIAAFALGAAATLVVGVRARAIRIGAIGLGLGVAGMMVVLGLTYPTRYTRAFDVRPLAAAAITGLPPDAVVYGHPDLRLGYDIYTGRVVVELPTDASVRAALATDAWARVIMPSSAWDAMAPTLGPGWRVLASATLNDRPIVLIGRAVP